MARERMPAKGNLQAVNEPRCQEVMLPMSTDEKWVVLGCFMVLSGIYTVIARRALASSDRAISIYFGIKFDERHYSSRCYALFGLAGVLFGGGVIVSHL